MSKAFTRESDDAPEQPILPRVASSLPPGVKNYMTADGAKRLRDDLDQLLQNERPRVNSSPESEDRRRELQLLDLRIATIQQSLQTAVVVEPPVVPDDEVRFGATVTVRDRAGHQAEYRFVGVDETDVDRGWVSWRSPLAKALIKGRKGQKVRLPLPTGDDELEIIEVRY